MCPSAQPASSNQGCPEHQDIILRAGHAHTSLSLAENSMQWGVMVPSGSRCLCGFYSHSGGVKKESLEMCFAVGSGQEAACVLGELFPAHVNQPAGKSRLLPGRFYVFRESFRVRGTCDAMVKEWVLTHRMKPWGPGMLLPAPHPEACWMAIQFFPILPPRQPALQAVHPPPQPWGSAKSKRAAGSGGKEELQRAHKGELTWYLLLFPGPVLFHLLES